MSIWKFEKNFIKKINDNFKLSIGEGETLLLEMKLEKNSLPKKVYVKREDKNPTGSFKDRSMAYLLSYYLSRGIKKFVISSSGNAAISLVKFSLCFKLNSAIFLSDKTDYNKIQRLKMILPNFKNNSNINIFFSKTPKRDAFQFAKKKNFALINGSIDDIAIEGYKSIAFELIQSNIAFDSIFIPCSSGTSAIGIINPFIKENLPVQLHIVQTTKINKIASHFDKDFFPEEKSYSTAICDKVARRKKKLIDLVNRSKGYGWVISNDELLSAKQELKSLIGEEISFDSALSYAGLKKSIKQGFNLKKTVLIFSGS